jgi:hypothetical protein
MKSSAHHTISGSHFFAQVIKPKSHKALKIPTVNKRKYLDQSLAMMAVIVTMGMQVPAFAGEFLEIARPAFM